MSDVLYPLAKAAVAGISLEDDHPPIDVDASAQNLVQLVLAAADDEQHAADLLRGVLRELVARARLRRAVRVSGARS